MGKKHKKESCINLAVLTSGSKSADSQKEYKSAFSGQKPGSIVENQRNEEQLEIDNEKISQQKLKQLIEGRNYKKL